MKNYLKITPILAVYVSLIACGGSSSNPPSNNNTATTPVASSTASTSTSTSTSRQFMGGIYDSPGYGEMTEIIFDGSQYTVTDFSYTQDNCLVQAEGKLSIEEFNDAIEFKDNNTILELKGTVIFEPAQQGKRIDSLPEKCKSGLLPLKGSKDYTFDADRDFKFLWDKVNEYHVGIEASKTNWDEIYSRFKPRVSSIKNEKQLLELFEEMLTPLADPHTTLVQGSLKDGINDLLNRPSGVDFAGKNKSSIFDIFEREYLADNKTSQLREVNSAIHAIQQNLLVTSIIESYSSDSSKIKRFGDEKNIISFITSNNVGYIEINSFDNFKKKANLADLIKSSSNAIDEIVNDMRDTVGIIIDVRRNTGGSSEMALGIVSRFIDTRTHVYSLQEKFGNTRTPLKKVYVKPQGNTQYIKPVVVLTSNTSFSAAETFTLAMKSRSNVTIIGEETNGGFSAPVSSRVTGEIAFEISNQIVLSADGK